MLHRADSHRASAKIKRCSTNYSLLTTFFILVTIFWIIVGLFASGYLAMKWMNEGTTQEYGILWVALIVTSLFIGNISLYFQICRIIRGTAFKSPRPYNLWLKFDMVYRFIGAAVILALMVLVFSVKRALHVVGVMWLFFLIIIVHAIIFRQIVFNEGTKMKAYIDQSRRNGTVSSERNLFRNFQQRQLKRAARFPWFRRPSLQPVPTGVKNSVIVNNSLYANRPIIKIDPASSQASEAEDGDFEDNLP
ncbi:unnamed protein product [Bursaphelenchus xylophilus]|uniref:(pine wood nematode) hypothetical protein n=1 Tax=Bursaphelenchus xylophilus TaxID=6326 RepID=A0A1I7RW79_BURXY|nr:unnamed protein product [Bursaphelenchus xylophilus]CAG9095243.1 unnamed protein product [Bursaphelenchus xylophilus]